MSCERYWHDGILLVERGQVDLHRDSCSVCRREHEGRSEMIQALSLVGSTFNDDPAWQVHVWSQIASVKARRTTRGWHLSGAIVTACAALLMCRAIGSHDEPPVVGSSSRAETANVASTRVEIISGEVAMRSGSPRVGDRVRISVKPADEVRVYSADQLVLRCSPALSGGGCVSDAHGMHAVAPLTIAGDYHLVVISSASAEPVGGLADDLQAIVEVGGDYRITDLSVH